MATQGAKGRTQTKEATGHHLKRSGIKGGMLLMATRNPVRKPVTGWQFIQFHFLHGF